MGRKILFITTDQQRYDSLGCNGNRVVHTPVVDRLAATGINFRRAYTQNSVCMPARSTMLTGQYPRTHGVFANGVPLPADAPSVARYLRDKAGYRTALIGKAHFEPHLDPLCLFKENRLALRGSNGPWRGFEWVELASHNPTNWRNRPLQHYGRWLHERDRHAADGFAKVLMAEPGGDTGAPEVKDNPIPRSWYHTDWVAKRTIAWLDRLPDDCDWFAWMSFPDPHPPWDPPASERHRVDWRELELPPGHPKSPAAIRKVLTQKPAHWLGYYQGTWENWEGGPANFRPAALTHDQVREIMSRTHIMNELVDEACGRVLQRIAERGWDRDTDIVFTSDHGELLGDYGLLYKGPFPVDALMRVPLIWRPAPCANVQPTEIAEPVGHVDLAATFCSMAGIEAAEWMQGRGLPAAPGSDRERALSEWNSQFPGYGFHLRSIYRDGWLCTAYEPSTKNQPNGLERFLRLGRFLMASGLVPKKTRDRINLGRHPLGPQSAVEYQGSEGELYRVEEDPCQLRNLWSDPHCRGVRADLLADMYAHLPAERSPGLKVARPT